MKPFFCIDTSKKDKKAVINGGEFVVASVQSENINEYRMTAAKIREIKLKADLPNILKIAIVVSAFMVIISIASIILSFFDAERAASLADGGYIKLIIAAFIGALFFAFLIYYSINRKKKILEGAELKEAENKLQSIIEKMEYELNIPENAYQTEILAFAYKIKNETLEINTAKDGFKKADNCKFKLYKEQESLVLCALDKKFAFSLNSLKCLKTEKEKLYLSYWHRLVKYNDESLKEYNLKLDSGKVVTDEYLSLYFEHGENENKEIWTVNFPIYEKETVENITGLKAE